VKIIEYIELKGYCTILQMYIDPLSPSCTSIRGYRMTAVVFPGRFRLLEKKKEWDGVELYRAYDRILKMIVFYKRYRGKDIITIEKIQREFRFLSSFHHPTLPVAYDTGRERDGSYYLTLEYLQGLTLREFYLSYGGDHFPAIICQTCRAIEYLHSRTVKAMNLTPDNVVVLPLSVEMQDMTTAAGKPLHVMVKFVGLENVVYGEERVDRITLPHNPFFSGQEGAPKSRTHPDHVPEPGSDPVFEPDMYTLGRILCWAFTGDLPCAKTDREDTGNEHPERKEIRIEDCIDRIPPEYADSVRSMLAPPGEMRPASPAEVRTLFEGRTAAYGDDLSYYLGKLDYLDFCIEETTFSALNGYPDGSDGRTAVFVRGEPGTGKTKLADEWEWRARYKGVTIFRINCRAETRITTGFVLRDLILKSIYFAGDLGLNPASQELAALSLIVPELKKSCTIRRPSFPNRNSFFRILLSFLLRVCGERKALVIVDDYHFCDNLSAEFLCFAMKRSTDAPITWLLTVDPSNVAGQNSLTDRVQEHIEPVDVTLTPFDPERMRRFLYVLFDGDSASLTLQTFLLDKSGGCPLYIREYLRYLCRHDCLKRNDAEWDVIEDFDPERAPEFFRACLSEILSTFDSSTLNFLKWIILFRGNIRSDLLVKESSRYFFRIREHLALLISKGILSRIPAGSNFVYRLNHPSPFIGDLLALDSREVAKYHGYLAEELERLPGNRREDVMENLAHHYFLGDQPVKALTYAVQAAEKARLLWAVDQACLWYRKAFELAQHMGDRDRLLEIMENLGDVNVQSGRAREGGDCYRHILTEESFHLKAAERPRILRKVGETFLHQSDFERALSCFRQGLAERFCSVKEALMIQLDISHSYRKQKKTEQAIAVLRGALETGESSEYPELTARCMNGLGKLYFDRGNFEEACWYYQASLEYKTVFEDAAFEGLIRNNLGIVFLRLGKVDESLHHFRRSLEKRREAGDPDAIASVLENCGIALWKAGETEKADNCFDEGITLFERAENWRGAASCYTRKGNMFRASGTHSAALECYHRSLDCHRAAADSDGIARMHRLLGMVCNETGDWKKSVEEYQESLRIYTESGCRTHVADVLLRLGTVQIKLGWTKEASANLQDAISISTEEGELEICAASFEQKALCHLMDDECGEAVRCLENGLRISGTIPDHPGKISLLNSLGRALVQAGEYEEAAEKLKVAIDLDGVEGKDQIDRRGDNPCVPLYLTFVYIAEAYTGLGEFDTAHEYWSNARQALQELSAGKEDGIVTCVEASITIARGRGEEGMKKLRESIRILKNTGTVPELMKGLFALGVHQIRFGESSGCHRTFLQIAHLLQDTSMEKHRELVDEIVQIMRKHEIAPVRKSFYESASVIQRLAAFWESDGDTGRMLQHALDLLLESIEGDRGAMFLIGDDTDTFLMKANNGVDPSTAEKVREMCRKIQRAYPDEPQRVFSFDAGHDEHVSKLLDPEGANIASFICLPLRHREMLLGAIYVDHLRIPGLTAMVEVDFAQNLADLITWKLFVSRKFDGVYTHPVTGSDRGESNDPMDDRSFSSMDHPILRGYVAHTLSRKTVDRESVIPLDRLEEVEKISIETALRKNGWVQTQAAAQLGISERTLRYKMRKHRIVNPRKKKV
jgi:tetratricopeptide (TPR) repeat protein/serine/threonine protein kinase/DNA-binding protein Fis